MYLQTQRFFSHGPFTSKQSGKRAFFLPVECGVIEDIQKLQAHCKSKLTCPKDAPAAWGETLEKAWKDVDATGVFANLSDKFHAFNRQKERIDSDALGRGFYTIRLHLPGVYLGDHSGEPSASLQVKVSQVVYEPDEEEEEEDGEVQCLIDMDS